MPALKPSRISEKDYLAGELTAKVRHEYVDGQIFAMSGESKRHNRIALNLASTLMAHLRGRPCYVTMEGVQVHIPRSRAYYYPDIVVSCPPDGKVVADEGRQVDEPTLIVEVLSPSTEGTDRREKFHAYRRVKSLQEYVIVAQDRHQVEIFRRQGDAGLLHVLYEPGEDVELTSVGLTLPMARLYEGTDTPVMGPDEG